MKDETTVTKLHTDPSWDDTFDPLEDNSADGDGDDQEFVGYIGTAENAHTPEILVDDRPAAVRIKELLETMPFQRRILLDTLSWCQTPQRIADVNLRINEMQAHNYSVYTAATLCSLLEQTNALKRVTAQGEPADTIEPQPEVVVVDGIEYFEAKPAPDLYWQTTPEGLAVYETDRPLERLLTLFDDEVLYRPIYQRILSLCSHDGGATTDALNDAVDYDPLVQQPRLYAPHFVDKLEKCDALRWETRWITTEIGHAGLETMDLDQDSAGTTAIKEA